MNATTTVDPVRASGPGGASLGALLFLMALTALGQLATNVVVPSLKEIGRETGLPAESLGLILSMVLLGLAVGQLVMGPLSDRLGRRPVLIVGLVLYVAGSLAATLAPTGAVLLAARAVQGFGASAGLALPRAVARDRYHGPHFLRTMAALTMSMSVMPGLAPLLGGVASNLYGWRAALALSVAAGVGMLLATLFSFAESHHQRTAGGLALTLSGYGHVLRNRRFLAYSAASGAAIGNAYVAVAGAQRYYVDLCGWSVAAFSLATALYAAGFVVGGLLSKHLESGRRLNGGLALLLLAPLGLLALSVLQPVQPLAWLGLTFLSQIGIGMLMPVAVSFALMAVDRAAGTASAVLGALHMVIGAGGAAVVALIPLPIVWSLPLAMLAFALLAILARLSTTRPR